MFQNLGCGVAHCEEDLIERAVFVIPIDQRAQLVGISKWSQRTVNQANDLTQMDLRGRPANR